MKRRLLILLAATGLLVSACGASGDSSSTAEEEGGGSSTTVAEASGSSFGSLKDVCGPGEAKLQAGEGSSTTTLNIGVANDRGSTVRPGLNKELWDASQSFAAWCNEQGGIDGMKINLIDMDGKLFEVEAAMAKACNDAFAMVGGAFTQDQLEFSGKDGTDFHKCKLIDIPGFAVSVEKGLSNGQVQPVPNPPNKKATQWITDAKTIAPEDMKKNVVVYGDLPSLLVVKKQYDAAVQEVGGIEQLPAISYPVAGLQDWTPLAQKVIDSGATSLYWVGEPSNAANLFKALRDQGWKGTIINETNIYDPLAFSAGNQAAEGILVRTSYHPFEEADKWPAIKQYQENLKKYVPDGKEASLGAQSTSAWLLFATAVKECAAKNGNTVTRQCVLSQAAAQEDWTGGGLHAPTNPGVTDPATCGLYVVAKNGAWERKYPEIGGKNDTGDGFHCIPDGIATVTVDLGAQGAVDPSRPPL